MYSTVWGKRKVIQNLVRKPQQKEAVIRGRESALCRWGLGWTGYVTSVSWTSGHALCIFQWVRSSHKYIGLLPLLWGVFDARTFRLRVRRLRQYGVASPGILASPRATRRADGVVQSRHTAASFTPQSHLSSWYSILKLTTIHEVVSKRTTVTFARFSDFISEGVFIWVLPSPPQLRNLYPKQWQRWSMWSLVSMTFMYPTLCLCRRRRAPYNRPRLIF